MLENVVWTVHFSDKTSWNSLFVGSNAVADEMAKKYEMSKADLLRRIVKISEIWKFRIKKKRSIIIVFYKLMLRLHTVWELDNIILHFYNL